MYAIEKDVEVPPKGKTSPKYPFGDMQVGDCFLIPIPDGELPWKIAARARTAAGNYGRRYPGYHFIVRTVDEGVRVWRTEGVDE